jgi:virulence-associated protein VagC
MSKTKKYVYAGQRIGGNKKLLHEFENDKETLWFSKNKGSLIGEFVDITKDGDGFLIEPTNKYIDDAELKAEYVMKDEVARNKRSHIIARQKAKKSDKLLGDMTVKELIEFANKSMSNGILVRHWVQIKTEGWKP